MAKTEAADLTIKVEHHPEAELVILGVKRWPIWEHDPARFPWQYDSMETCYFLEGDVTVTPDDGLPVHLGPGDFVTFPDGLSCTWEIRKKVRKHYRWGS
ncbi:MAG: cupin domain-containing protein [Acidiferrobacteraceae bacterium]